MSSKPLASIIISSYNYARYLRAAIESAVAQTYPCTEVVVVDDHSSDESPEIIREYSSRVIPILREQNKGGSAAYNESLSLCRGEVILLLDSDDALETSAVESVMEYFRDPNVVKVHWPLVEVDEQGQPTGNTAPRRPLPEGRLREVILRDGLCSCASPPTSGNAWSRRFLENVLPVPKGAYCDAYLSALACAHGIVRKVSEPKGFYRVHGRNSYSKRPFEEWLRVEALHDHHCCRAVSDYMQRIGLSVTVDDLKQKSWYQQRYIASQEIATVVPEGSTFILLDEDNWATGGRFSGRRILPFPEFGGAYAGIPPDDCTAIEEFNRLLVQFGPRFFVVAWPAFWWMDFFASFTNYVRSRFPCVLENNRLVVFELGNRTLRERSHFS